jgi:hypothetical protein
MHPYLTRLGVRPEVQAFFAPFFSAGSADLLFQQGNYREHFGLTFHRVDADGNLWIAGERNFAIAQRVFIAGSVMDLMAYLHFYGHSVRYWNKCLFIAAGVHPVAAQLQPLFSQFSNKPVTLLFPADVLGAITDLNIATAFRSLPVAAFLAEKERLNICFRSQVFEFDQRRFSLSAFERAAKYRFNVSTRKPKHGASFLDQLKAGAFPSP